MTMAYTTNPNIARVRMDAVKLVRSGWSVREVARHFGYTHSAIVKWCARAPEHRNARIIPTRSSRPRHHPRQLADTLVRSIIEERQRTHRCAFFLHHMLLKDGHTVSLSSVKRVLKRNQMSRFSLWKKWHIYPPRPTPKKPGILVETDTIHDGVSTNRLYVYVLIDVYSRWAFALPSPLLSTHRSLRFIETARPLLPFTIQTLQSDHGPEFSKWFTKRIEERGLFHRHSRVRQPNDNAHVERFNRTLQEECVRRLNRNLQSWQTGITDYLHYYNTERPHMGLHMQTPLEILKSVPRS